MWSGMVGKNKTVQYDAEMARSRFENIYSCELLIFCSFLWARFFSSEYSMKSFSAIRWCSLERFNDWRIYKLHWWNLEIKHKVCGMVSLSLANCLHTIYSLIGDTCRNGEIKNSHWPLTERLRHTTPATNIVFHQIFPLFYRHLFKCDCRKLSHCIGRLPPDDWASQSGGKNVHTLQRKLFRAAPHWSRGPYFSSYFS